MTGFKTVMEAWATGKARKIKNDRSEIRACGIEPGIDCLTYHGNTIAYYRSDTPGWVYFTLAGWGTVTTRARLNTLLDWYGIKARFHQHKHEQYFNDEKCNEYDVFSFHVDTKEIV